MDTSVNTRWTDQCRWQKGWRTLGKEIAEQEESEVVNLYVLIERM